MIIVNSLSLLLLKLAIYTAVHFYLQIGTMGALTTKMWYEKSVVVDVFALRPLIKYALVCATSE